MHSTVSNYNTVGFSRGTVCYSSVVNVAVHTYTVQHLSVLQKYQSGRKTAWVGFGKQ